MCKESSDVEEAVRLVVSNGARLPVRFWRPAELARNIGGLTQMSNVSSRVATVLERYALRTPHGVGELPGSKRNENLVVEDGEGHRYVLRWYRRNPDVGRIRFQLRFQEHLAEAGIPTSRIVEADHGEPLLVDRDEVYVLFTYVAGSEYDFENRDQVREAARWLVRFHVAAGSFVDDGQVGLATIPDVRRWWTDGERELASLEQMFDRHGVVDELGFLRAWHRELLMEWPLERLDALPSGWVHGDYHGRNMVFDGNRLRGLFDFDVVHRGYRIEDVAYAVFSFARPRRDSHRVRADVARLFVAEYAREYPLSSAEFEALPAMAAAVQARTAPRYELRRRLGEDPAEALREHVARM